MAFFDPNDIAQDIKVAAQRFILPRFQMLKNDEISTKTSPSDLVTQADLDVEAYLDEIWSARYPGFVILGEESVSSEEKSLDLLHDPDHKGVVFVIDPVDGTYNFVHGKDDFAVMVTCVIDGVCRFSWIYDVLGDRMVTSELGQGAWMSSAENPNERLQVRDSGETGDITAHVSTKFFPDDMRPKIDASAAALASVKPLGCAGHEYLRVATGQTDITIYSRLKPWDHLPGVLMVQEAGGYVAKWDGQPYTPRDMYAGLIGATSQESWQKIYDLFFKDIDLSTYVHKRK